MLLKPPDAQNKSKKLQHQGVLIPQKGMKRVQSHFEVAKQEQNHFSDFSKLPSALNLVSLLDLENQIISNHPDQPQEDPKTLDEDFPKYNNPVDSSIDLP